MEQRTVGVGVIGAGRVFEQHARACSELRARARLLAVADVDEMQLRQATSQHFIPFVHSDYRSLLDRRDVELVAICTPPAAHERMVIDALDAGKFVMCEKPLAHSLEAADRIVAAATRHPGKLSTVFQFRYLPEVRRARRLADSGHLGRLLFGRFSRYGRFDSVKPSKPGKARKVSKERSDWWGRWSVAGGGMVMTQLIHDLDLMCHLFGAPIEVTAVVDTLKASIESEDSCSATVRFESGAVACCYGTMTAHRTACGFDVIGELASAHSPWAFEGGDRKRRHELEREVMMLYPSAEKERGTLASRLASRLRGARQPALTTAHAPYLSAVLDALAEGRPLPIGPEEARTALELCTAAYESALRRLPAALPTTRGNPYYSGISADDYEARHEVRS